MPSEVLQHYRNLMDEPSGCFEAMCWSVVGSAAAPVVLEDLVRRLGGDPDNLEVLDLNEAYDLGPNDGWVLHLDQVGGAVTVFENNGYQCSRPEVLSALSVGTEAYSACWSVNCDSRLSYAAYGELLTSFDGLAPDYRQGAQPEALDDHLGDLYETVNDPGLDFRAGMLAVIERRTAVRLDRDWLRREHEAILIPTRTGPGAAVTARNHRS